MPEKNKFVDDISHATVIQMKKKLYSTVICYINYLISIEHYIKKNLITSNVLEGFTKN